MNTAVRGNNNGKSAGAGDGDDTTMTVVQDVPQDVKANANANAQRYEVLYYKRSKKVHKTKGTSRLDGILTIHPPPSCQVTLVPSGGDDDDGEKGSDDDDVDDDDDDGDGDEDCGGKKMSFKKKMQAMRKKRNRANLKSSKKQKKNTAVPSRVKAVYSSVNKEVAKHVFDKKKSLMPDDILALSGWECEVISRLQDSGGMRTEMMKKKASGVSVGVGVGAGRLGNKNVKGNGMGIGVVSKAVPKKTVATTINGSSAIGTASKKKVFTMTRRPLTSSLISSSSLSSGKRTHLLKKKNENVASSLSTKKNVPVKRKPPAQPKKKEAGDEDDDDFSSSDEEIKSFSSSSSVRGGGAICNTLQSKKRKLGQNITDKSTTLGSGIVRSRSNTPTPTRTASTPKENDECFTGAIGYLQAPASIKSILRPHQQSGVVFLWNCLTGSCPKLQKLMKEKAADLDMNVFSGLDGMDDDDDMEVNNVQKQKGGAILADEMGLGKTLMTITVLYALHRRNRNDRFIIVCPSSLVSNWAKEFDKFVGKASNPRRVIIRKGGEEGLQKIKSFVPFKRQRSEVLIISYDLFRMNKDILSQATNVGLLVVDEGHRLKNTSGSLTLSALNSLKCGARLLITGTPIQNNLSEFYNVANFVLPGILGDLNSFRRVYERPMAAASKKNASWSQREEGAVVSRELDRTTSNFMIRRLQKDVLSSLLPPRFETVLFCRASAIQRKLYRELVRDAHKDSLSTLTKLRKLCSHPNLVDDSVSLDTSNSEDFPSDSSKAGKLDVLEGLLDAIRHECPTDKVVLVSNFTSALTVIEDFILKPRGWSSLRLDGTLEQSSRQALVDSFNRGNVQNSFVFLLSSKAGGCGLNLIGGNRLIMVDPDWNPSTDQQAMARIYRQGQTKQCHIYRLLTTGTVEEVIYQRQTQKNNLDTIGSEKSRSNSNRFTDEELKDCFTLKERCDCDTRMKIGKKWPEYDGVESLLDLDVDDKPLLRLAQKKHEILTYVHLVKESVADILMESEGAENIIDKTDDQNKYSGHDSEDSSEAEFDG